MKPIRYTAIALILSVAFSIQASQPSHVTKEEAITIASNFTKINAKHYESWTVANRFKTTKIFNDAGEIVAYEVGVAAKNGTPLGYVNVPSVANRGTVVSSFGYDGKTITESMIDLFKNERLETLTQSGYQIVSYKFTGNTLGATGVKIVTKNSNGTEEIIYFNPNPTSIMDGENESQLERSIDEEKVIREALLNGDLRNEIFSTIKKGSIDTNKFSTSGQNSVDGVFSNFYQENRAWTKGTVSSSGTCVAGCAPVAWAILLEYWDRNGFPMMVSSASDNTNTTTTDPDTQWTINELRGHLNTTCSVKNNGATSGDTHPWYMTRGEYYAVGRGYLNSSASSTYAPTVWWDLISAIDAKKPPIAHIDSTGGGNSANHAVVVYSYVDNWGTASDNYCFKTGWQVPTYNCFTGQNSLKGLTRVTIAK